LRGFRFEHYDAARAAVKVLGKGGKWRTIPLEDSELRSALDAYIAQHVPEPGEHLLYPEKVGAVRWEDRRKALSDTATHRWWHACLNRAGVKHLPMHSARHTAITDIIRDTGNLKSRPGLRRARVNPDDGRHLRALRPGRSTRSPATRRGAPLGAASTSG